MGGSAKPAGDQDKDSRARWRTPSWGQDGVLVHGGLAFIWLQWAPGGSQGRPWLPCSVSVSVAHIWIPSIFSRLEPGPWGPARSLQRCVCQHPCLLCKKTKGRPACWFGFIRRWLWTGGQCPVASIPLRRDTRALGLGMARTGRILTAPCTSVVSVFTCTRWIFSGFLMPCSW